MVVASFRGTQTMTNWINNLKAVYVSARKSGFGDEFKGCKLHLGFWATFNSIGRECVDEIARLHEVHPDYEVFVCGHSLGGAMATYCTLQVALRGVPVQGYTFGQPRTGNAKWARLFNKRVTRFYRIVNNYDVVPHLPGTAMGFAHVGAELWFSSGVAGSKLKKNPLHVHGPVADKFSLQQLRDTCSARAPFWKLIVIDHLVYYERVQGKSRVEGEPIPDEPVKEDGRLVLVSDTLVSSIMNPAFNVLLLVYTSHDQAHSHTHTATPDDGATEGPKPNRWTSLTYALRSLVATSDHDKRNRSARSLIKQCTRHFQHDDSFRVAQIDASKNQVFAVDCQGIYPALWFIPGGGSPSETTPKRISADNQVPRVDSEIISFDELLVCIAKHRQDVSKASEMDMKDFTAQRVVEDKSMVPPDDTDTTDMSDTSDTIGTSDTGDTIVTETRTQAGVATEVEGLR
ncbi:hypothetical protein SARC_03616 [Sphaeroforma arctica JP610]|uniref:Fungal lipase-type domain-containing protein n=1 Tax=Sphaeroforma arctica JP610 TaxID=667725 RepID=A0A0L0G560_9EUKA|nr:hypothetical protein SARC_03616 [Sphaeroforma arctica JP610]KNC84160.1 hypothetical protein SARC_03616 [Sphaeroforma arctica JP610]|eukprot:XP_014158062.1 hypothetical protein SARC_03616 [Sphaeroforma arctica JP610]